MSEFDYYVQVYDIGTPLANSITTNELLSILQYHGFQEWYQNTFQKWSKTNISKINKYTDELLDQYLMTPMKEIKNKLFPIQKTNNKDNFGQLIDRHTNPIMVGGNETVRNIIIGILYYIFSKNYLDYDLPEPISVSDHFSGGAKFDILENINVGEHRDRLIFKISASGVPFYLKIYYQEHKRDAKGYVIKSKMQIETEIYEELSTTSQKGHIIRLFKVGNVNYSAPYCKFDFYSVVNNTLQNREIYKLNDDKTSRFYNAYSFLVDMGIGEIKYNILEADDNFITLRSCQHSLNASIKKVFLIDLIRILTELHIEIEFSHWDLHTANVLINKYNLTAKLFDFDLSMTGKNFNSSTLSSYNWTNIYNAFIAASDARETPNALRMRTKAFGIGYICDLCRIYNGIDFSDVLSVTINNECEEIYNEIFKELEANKNVYKGMNVQTIKEAIEDDMKNVELVSKINGYFNIELQKPSAYDSYSFLEFVILKMIADGSCDRIKTYHKECADKLRRLKQQEDEQIRSSHSGESIFDPNGSMTAEKDDDSEATERDVDSDDEDEIEYDTKEQDIDKKESSIIPDVSPPNRQMQNTGEKASSILGVSPPTRQNSVKSSIYEKFLKYITKNAQKEDP